MKKSPVKKESKLLPYKGGVLIRSFEGNIYKFDYRTKYKFENQRYEPISLKQYFTFYREFVCFEYEDLEAYCEGIGKESYNRFKSRSGLYDDYLKRIKNEKETN